MRISGWGNSRYSSSILLQAVGPPPSVGEHGDYKAII